MFSLSFKDFSLIGVAVLVVNFIWKGGGDERRDFTKSCISGSTSVILRSSLT